MDESKKDLGNLVGVYGISPVYLQRAVFIAVLSFAFFLAMMVAFYLLQSIGYFLLATAFLLVYLITMFSWVLQRRTALRVFEDGFAYKSNKVRWDEIKVIDDEGVITLVNDNKIAIPKAINNFGILLNVIRARAVHPG